MDFWSRLVGGTYAPKRPDPRPQANDPRARLDRFQRVYKTVVDLCLRPRDPVSESSILNKLQGSLERLAALVREETRAPVPHICLQFAATNQIYTTVARAATTGHYEPVVVAAVAVLAALVDSDEEDFFFSAPFAKSLMRMVSKIIDGGSFLIGADTETMILELLFTVTAKIRLQPEILSVWFQSTVKPELEDVFVKEKKSFVGITQKDDFPLCYLLIDRVHHEGRIGDFARTGLLYIFEATGRSSDLEEWVISSDLPTLMASGLGALYSQLSRELSILHPDATLPPVLAMSDYSTVQSQATAESAFSEQHRSHMATFLSYLEFWQDVLDHCRSSDVKQTLLDHFQILFLQQLLYPSILQSSDTDAGSSVAVLTYMTAMLEALDYPDLIHMMLTYLLAIQEEASIIPSAPTTPVRPSMPPRSPTAVRRRQSLMLLTAPTDPDDAVEPSLFNLVDLTLNSLRSINGQTIHAALRLIVTTMERQKRFAFGTLLKVHKVRRSTVARTAGGLELETEQYLKLASSLHRQYSFDEAYSGLCNDVRNSIEAQIPFKHLQLAAILPTSDEEDSMLSYSPDTNEPLLRSTNQLLRTFLTNAIDVNLALTQALIAIFSCPELRLDGWVAIDPTNYVYPNIRSGPEQTWRQHLDDDEKHAWYALRESRKHPYMSLDGAPVLFATLTAVVREADSMRKVVPNLDPLLTGRKIMLQASNAANLPSEPESLFGSPHEKVNSGLSTVPKRHTRSQSTSSTGRGRTKAKPASNAASANARASSTAGPARDASELGVSIRDKRSIYQPPPPETPPTTDILHQKIRFPPAGQDQSTDSLADGARKSSLNHILTNIVILQEFILELVAVLQVRAAVLGEQEIRYA